MPIARMPSVGPLTAGSLALRRPRLELGHQRLIVLPVPEIVETAFSLHSGDIVPSGRDGLSQAGHGSVGLRGGTPGALARRVERANRQGGVPVRAGRIVTEGR